MADEPKDDLTRGFHEITKDMLKEEAKRMAEEAAEPKPKKKYKAYGGTPVPDMFLKPGAHTRYRSAYDGQARMMAELGATNEMIADHFQISRQTFYQWCIDHPSFKEAIYTVPYSTPAAESVERSLLDRARGYTTKTRKKKWVEVDGIPIKAVEITEEEVHVPSSAQHAGIFLKNRRKGLWDQDEKVEDNRKVIVIVPGTAESIEQWKQQVRQYKDKLIEAEHSSETPMISKDTE